jgi:prolyl-tRNA synthetase
MRYSRTLIPTIKEVPSDAEIISHQLMLRAGLMRKVASGTYAYLPAGWRVLLKIMAIVRQEMDAAGALDCTMPMVQPYELWQKTGRDVDYGETLGQFIDRHGRKNVLSPTAEEVMTFVAAGEINSYKQLPINLYQINLKYRDEFRPRFGVLRSREFIMKDAYSFDADEAMLDRSYRAMYDAYCRVFSRCGLEYVIVEAETGEMGGSGSHQFTIPCANGEDVIVHFEDNSRAWNIEKAPVDPLPRPTATQVAAPQDVHTPHVGSIESVCAFLKVQPVQLIKTLIYSAGGKTVVALVRGDHEVNPEKLGQAAALGHIELASEATIERVTGAKVGFAGPVGLAGKIDLLLIDPAVAAMTVAISGANKTDHHTINVVPGRDFALEGNNVRVIDIRLATQGDTYLGRPLLFKRGIEVGQVFKLGRKYSEKLGVKFLDTNGAEQIALMGCYGIGVNRIMASAIELYNDADGIRWPISISPWEVILTTVGADQPIVDAAEKLYANLTRLGVEVLYDDRDLRPGVKFKDADLLGIPIRATIGKKALDQGKIELKLRSEKQNTLIDIAAAADSIAEMVNILKAKLNRTA